MALLQRLLRLAGKAPAGLGILIVWLWQNTLSRILPPSCRFSPSCSAYGIEALQRHGLLKGGWLALWRLLRCNPWGGAGRDPVPMHFSFFPRSGDKDQ